MPDPETGDSTADLSAALEQAELRELAWSALAGLEPGDREIVELSMRHEFYGADLADALGMPRNQAHGLGSRARQRFDTAVSTLVAARTGYGSCPALAEILGSWEGELTPSMRREVRQHIAECGACGAERRRAVSPSAMLALLPVPALPEDLRYQVLGVITDGSADAVRYCGAVAERAEPFLRSGFPAALDPLAAVRGPTSFIPAAGVLVAVFAVFGGGAMLAANYMHHSPSTGGSALTPVTLPTASQPAPVDSLAGGRPGRIGEQDGAGHPGGGAAHLGPAAHPAGQQHIEVAGIRRGGLADPDGTEPRPGSLAQADHVVVDPQADQVVGPADHGPTDHGPTDHGTTDDGPADHGTTDDGPADHGPADHGAADHGAAVLDGRDAGREQPGLTGPEQSAAGGPHQARLTRRNIPRRQIAVSLNRRPVRHARAGRASGGPPPTWPAAGWRVAFPASGQAGWASIPGPRTGGRGS